MASCRCTPFSAAVVEASVADRFSLATRSGCGLGSKHQDLGAVTRHVLGGHAQELLQEDVADHVRTCPTID